MEHKLFRPNSFLDGQNQVVGNCNGFTMQQRWDAETPVFASAIVQKLNEIHGSKILDYGCGVGRLAKAVLEESSKDNLNTKVVGLDASADMLKEAVTYVKDNNFSSVLPQDLGLDNNFDIIYCKY